MELLARAAFQCGAHARALLYFESHVRAKEKGTLNPVALTSTTYEDDDVSFFQVCNPGMVIHSTTCICYKFLAQQLILAKGPIDYRADCYLLW